MSTTDRAAEVINDTFGVLAVSAESIAYELAKEGLLMPDLPEPVENESNGNPSWFNGWVEQDWGEVELRHNECSNGEEETTFTAKEARGLAYALLAAANHAARQALEDANGLWNLPLHRTEAGYPNCSTCDGGGCPDCTDPA